jgi:branched-chain amino acid transport system ATP-binding protein
MSELEVRGLSVSYGKVQAVQGIDLDAREGSIVAVLGSNGAGKSSTLNAISGVVRRAAGRVVFRGQDVTRWPPDRIARAGLVQVPEGRRIFAPLTVEENLLLGSYSVARSKAGDPGGCVWNVSNSARAPQ